MINEEIRDKEIRLIDVDGSMLGIMSAKEAQKIAVSKNLDLVKIAPQAVPSVCRIMDYGKYMFEHAKKEKEAKEIKRLLWLKIRISPNIESHDFNYKVKNAIRFLQNSDKVKVTVRFRGREMNYTSLGQEALESFAKAVEEYGVMEKKPKLEGRSMSIVINPK